MNKLLYCNNCGYYGHEYHKCRHPILSYGVILYTYDKNINEYKIVLIERKDSISYIEFLRGKYNINDIDYIKLLFSRFSKDELKRVIEYPFDKLWVELWINVDSINYKLKREYNKSKRYFNILKNGYKINNININISYFVNNVSHIYLDNEWEIPKGRRILKESNKECAIREFEEETNISKDKFNIYSNIAPIIEEYKGINNIPYKHVYYIAKIKEKIKVEINLDNKDQYTEVKDIKWLNKSEALNNIRNHDNPKKKVINDIFTFISNNQNYLFL